MELWSRDTWFSAFKIRLLNLIFGIFHLIQLYIRWNRVWGEGIIGLIGGSYALNYWLTCWSLNTTIRRKVLGFDGCLFYIISNFLQWFVQHFIISDGLEKLLAIFFANEVFEHLLMVFELFLSSSFYYLTHFIHFTRHRARNYVRNWLICSIFTR